jgi:hypothetical protein
MPDAILFSQAVALAAGAGAVIALLAGRLARGRDGWKEAAALLAFVLAAVLGYCQLGIRPVWPPLNALDRFLAIVLPSMVAIETLIAIARVPCWSAWLLRVAMAASASRVLLAGSVYLGDSDEAWTLWQTAAVLTAGGGLLLLTWCSLTSFEKRGDARPVIPLALAMSLFTSGMAIMLAGYIKGGAAALPLAAALIGISLVSKVTTKESILRPTAGVAVVALFSLLFIGVFFGRLSMGRAVTILLAPLACGFTQLAGLRRQKTWIAAAIGLLLVAIPLAAVLILAKRDFDQKLAPLLGSVPTNSKMPLI